MTRLLERRLERLEAIFGRAGCECGEPKVIVVHELDKSADAIEAEVAAQRTRCPMHGFGPDLIVTLRSFSNQ